MKKMILIFLFLCLFFPYGIKASTMRKYGEADNYKSQYINRFSNYQRYILSGKSGMISKSEFTATLVSGSSYLINGKEYWTSSVSDLLDNAHYYVGSGLNTKTNDKLSGVRVTEYIKHGISVKGNGTYNTPWEFVDAYSVKVASSINDPLVSVTVNTPLVSFNSSANITIKEAYGYMYSGKDDCNLVKKSVALNDPYLFEYEIRNIKKDVDCVAKFEPRKITIKYNCAPGEGTVSSQVVNYNGSYSIKGALCARSGYEHVGWESAGTTFNLNQTGTWTIKEGESGLSNNVITLRAVYKDITSPTVKLAAVDKNNNSTVLQSETTFKPSDGTSAYTGDFNVKNGNWFNKQLQLNFTLVDASGIKNVYRRYNSANSATAGDYTNPGDVTIDGIKWNDITSSFDSSTGKLTSYVNDGGYRKLQYLVIDNNDNKSTITVTAKMDLVNPTCTLEYDGTNIKFKSKTDALTSVASYGMGNSSTPSYNSKTSVTFANGTTYGYVKDEGGNENKCSLTFNETPNYRIANNYYITLEDAFKAASNNNVIYLLHNYTDSSNATTNKTVSLNLSNHSLTRSNDSSGNRGPITSSGGTLTLLGGGSSGTLNARLVSTGGNLVIRGAYLSNRGYAVHFDSGSGTLTTSGETIGSSTVKTKITSTAYTPVYRDDDAGGNMTLENTNIFTTFRNKNAIHLGEKTGTTITIGNGCILGNGYTDADGSGDSDYGTRAAVITIRGANTAIIVEGDAIIAAGEYAGDPITARASDSSVTINGSASLYANNSTVGSGMFCVESAKHNNVSPSGVSVTFNTSGEIHARGGRVYGETNVPQQSLTVSKGSFCCNPYDDYLFYNGKPTNKKLSVSDGSCNFVKMTNIDTTSSATINNLKKASK